MGEYKQAKSDSARKAGRPVFGCISMLVFGGFSWVIAPQVQEFIVANTFLEFPGDWPEWLPTALVALFIFAMLFTVSMALIGILAGSPKDPLDARIPDAAYKRRRR